MRAEMDGVRISLMGKETGLEEIHCSVILMQHRYSRCVQNSHEYRRNIWKLT